MRNILYIVPSDFGSLKKKGVVDMIKERDEGVFFDKVITLHPFTRSNKEINLSNNNKIIEYGWKTDIDFLDKLFITKILGTIGILFKLAFIFPFVIKKEKIDIIRATDPYYMGLLGLYYSKIFKIPVVVSIHSDYDKRFILDGSKGSFTIFGSRNLAKKLEKFVYKNVDKILPIREYMRLNIISEFKIDEGKVEVFPHGVNFKEFDEVEFIDIYEKFGIDRSKKIISFVGRLSKENYIYHLIDIARKLKKLREDFVLLIVGGGNEYENVKNIVVEQYLDNVIYFTGFQNKEIVVNVRKQNYLALTLMGGFSLIEACAGARPVIAYDIEWHYELVKNNETGFLIEENNIDEVVKKIIYLLDNPSIAEKLGKNARELALKRHDMNNVIKIKQNIYEGILSK